MNPLFEAALPSQYDMARLDPNLTINMGVASQMARENQAFQAQEEQKQMLAQVAQQKAQDQQVMQKYQQDQLMDALLGPKSVNLGGGPGSSAAQPKDRRSQISELEKFGLFDPNAFQKIAGQTALGQVLFELGLSPESVGYARQIQDQKSRDEAQFQRQIFLQQMNDQSNLKHAKEVGAMTADRNEQSQNTQLVRDAIKTRAQGIDPKKYAEAQKIYADGIASGRSPEDMNAIMKTFGFEFDSATLTPAQRLFSSLGLPINEGRGDPILKATQNPLFQILQESGLQSVIQQMQGLRDNTTPTAPAPKPAAQAKKTEAPKITTPKGYTVTIK
jgi:hypothetical protein